jgi:hypothetical protein
VVNLNTWWPLVRDGDDYYELTVVVPALSQMAPPAPTPTPAAP